MRTSGVMNRENIRNQEQKEEMNVGDRYSRSSMELMIVTWRVAF